MCPIQDMYSENDVVYIFKNCLKNNFENKKNKTLAVLTTDA